MNLTKTFTSFNEGITEIMSLVDFNGDLGFGDNGSGINNSGNETTEMDVIDASYQNYLDGYIHRDETIVASTMLPALKRVNNSTGVISVLAKINDIVSISWEKTIDNDNKYRIMFSIAKNVVIARKMDAAIVLMDNGWVESKSSIIG